MMTSVRQLRHSIMRIWYDLKYGEGWVVPHCMKIAKYWNPVRPGFWRRNTPPFVNLSDEYTDVVPYAYWTGEGWLLAWGAVDVDYGYVDPLVEATDVNESDTYIYEWPFILPVCSTEDLEHAGFYIEH